MTQRFSVVMGLVMGLCHLAWPYTPQDGNINATVAYHWLTTNFAKAGSAPPSPYDGGLGLIVNGDIGTRGALEISIFQINKRFFRESRGLYRGEKIETVHISMGYRWWLTERLSTSLAFYSAYGIGDVHMFRNDFNDSERFKTSAHDLTEYGFDATVQVELWQQGQYGVVASGLYSYSATRKYREYSDHYGYFVGIRYLVQESKPNNIHQEPKP